MEDACLSSILSLFTCLVSSSMSKNSTERKGYLGIEQKNKKYILLSGPDHKRGTVHQRPWQDRVSNGHAR